MKEFVNKNEFSINFVLRKKILKNLENSDNNTDKDGASLDMKIGLLKDILDTVKLELEAKRIQEENYESLETERDDLAHNYKTLDNEIALLKLKNSECTAECEKLKQSGVLSLSLPEKQKTLSEFSQIEVENSNLTKELKELKLDYVALTRLYDKEKLEFESDYRDELLNDSKSIINDLKKQNCHQKSCIEDLQNELTKSKSEFKRIHDILRRKVQELQASVKSHESMGTKTERSNSKKGSFVSLSSQGGILTKVQAFKNQTNHSDESIDFYNENLNYLKVAAGDYEMSMERIKDLEIQCVYLQHENCQLKDKLIKYL